jgi:hypothetical protein
VRQTASNEEIDKNEGLSNENQSKAKKRQRGWVKEMVFSNNQEAEKAVIKENLWSNHPTHTMVDGKRSSSDAIR